MREDPVGFPGGTAVENPPAMQETQESLVPSLGWEDPPEKEMATHSSILAWRILWTEEPGGPRFIGPHRTWLKQLSTAPILSFTFSELLSQTPLS